MSAAVGKRAFLSLGANLGDRAASLAAAREALAALPATTLLAASHLYETEPQDLADQPEFLNQVVCLQTELAPHDLLAACGRIEEERGRTRTVRFGPRTLDVDILLFQDVEMEDAVLTIPHPRLSQRAFVLVPLAELWHLAEGVFHLDVPALAQATARVQAVRRFNSVPGGHN